MNHKLDLSNFRISQVERLLRYDDISLAQARKYVKEWNTTERRTVKARVTLGRLTLHLFQRVGPNLPMELEDAPEIV